MINKFFWHTTALLTMALTIVSCGSGKDSETDSVFAPFSKSSTYSLVNSAKSYMCAEDVTINDSVSFVLPIKLNGQPADALCDSISLRAFGIVMPTIEEATDCWMDSLVNETGYATRPSTVAPNLADGFHRIDGRIVNFNTKILSYCIATSVYYPGAANGMETLDYFNYSMELNRMITLRDLFTEEGIIALPSLISEQANNNSKYAGEVTIDALPANDNFYLSSEGEIVFSYQPMEVGPHSLGNVQIAFWPSELVNYMTRQAILNYDLEDLVNILD